MRTFDTFFISIRSVYYVLIVLNDLIMRRIAFFLMSIYCFTACNNELTDIPAGPEDDNNLPIELILPDAEKVNVYSTATTSENTIDTLWVIIFKGNDRKWVEKIEGSKIVRNGNASQLLPQLKHKPNDGDSIFCIANVDPNPDTTSVTPATINNCFKLDENGYYFGTERLPMYGAFRWSDMGGSICVMRRAVAKIQVQMGTSVSDVTTNFTAENVTYTLYNGAYRGYIKPTTPLSGIASAALVYSRERYHLLQYSGVTEKNSNIYLYEYHSATNALNQPVSDTQFNADRQHILLHKDNGGGDTTHYRLDFYDKITKKFLDTKRNHHYIFTIDKVRSEGYKSRAEAQDNPASNIEYTIVVGDNSKDVVSNGQYAIVLSMDTVIFKDPAAQYWEIGTVKYLLPPEMLSSWTTTTNSISIQTLSSTTGDPVLIYPTTITSVNQMIFIETSPMTLTATAIVTFQLGNIIYKKPLRIIAGVYG